MNRNLILLVILLAVNLLNFEYEVLSTFNFGRKEYLEIVVIIICIVGIIYELKGKKQVT